MKPRSDKETVESIASAATEEAIDSLSGVAIADRSAYRRSSVARSAGIISAAVMLSRLLGLVREMVFAYFFGASKSYAMDAYNMAFRIPNLLRDLFAEGALSSAFVKVFSDYLVRKGEAEAFRLSNLIVTALVVVLSVMVVLGLIFTPEIVTVIAPGFKNYPEKFALTVRLTRIMMPFIMFVALAAQAMGVLNARDRFGVPALAASFFNIGSIVGGLAFAMLLTDPKFSHPVSAILDNPIDGIVGMAYGVLIGGLLQYLVQWPSLRREGFRYRPMLNFNDPGVRQVLKLMGPAVIGSAAVLVNVFVNSNFASRIPGNGPVAWLQYAFRLMQFPIGVFGVAIGTATLPAISRSAALEQMGEFKRTLAGSIRLALLLTIPSAVGLMVLGRPIIALIYERGGFRQFDTEHTAATLAFYSIGLAGYSLVKILAPAFYALDDARTPMTVSLIAMIVNFMMNWMLVDVLQERGLALSTSVSALLNFALLYLIMRRRIGDIEDSRNAATVAKIMMASAVMAIVCWAISSGIARAFSASKSGFVVKALSVAVSVGTGAVVFYLGALLLGIDELKAAASIVGRFAKRLR
jgi:putative peptidoglycan lipid II flippase